MVPAPTAVRDDEGLGRPARRTVIGAGLPLAAGLLLTAALGLAPPSTPEPTARAHAAPAAMVPAGTPGGGGGALVAWLPALLDDGQFRAAPTASSQASVTPSVPTTPQASPTPQAPRTPSVPPTAPVPFTPSASPTPPVGPTAPVTGTRFVAPDATPGGDGTFEHPWTLQTALDHPAALQPGDTVWLRGGTYSATNLVDPSLGRISFLCKTQGRAGAPIVFRNWRDERATIDGKDNQVALFVQSCTHTWFWGLEVMSSDPVRSPSRAYIYVTAPEVKFINMVLHDMSDGLDLWTTARNAELYGSIIYHNGWDETNGGHGHGIYTQNDLSGTKRIHDNVFFSQYGFNVRAWSTNQFVDNFDLQGNIAFNGGSLSEFASRKFNFFIVSNNPKGPTRNLVARQNYTFAGRTTTTPPCNAFGPNYGTINMRLEENYLLGQFRVTGPYVNATIAGNKILGGTTLPFLTGTGFAPADYPDNTYAQDVPTEGADVFVRPNRYEPGRAHIAVYNWSGAPSVTVNVAGIGLDPGDRYDLINAMDYYGDRITGIYPAGGDIVVPMTGHTFARAIGSTKPPVSQFPEFGVFVIRRAGAASSS